MIRSTTIALATTAVLAMANTANAQSNNNNLGFRLAKPMSDARDVTANMPPQVTMMRTAMCLADSRTEEVTAYLATTPASEAEDAALETFSKKLDKCMPNMDMSSVGNMRRARGRMTMNFEHAALRGALAESLMRENDTAINVAELTLGDEGMYVAERFHGQRSAEPARAFTLGFAGCVMARNAGAMEALLQTQPASAEEKAAVVAMAPSFGECVMEGQTLSIVAPTMRNQLAETIYYATAAASADGKMAAMPMDNNDAE